MEVGNARKSAVERQGTTITPASALKIAWPEEIAVPTSKSFAKVSLSTPFLPRKRKNYYSDSFG